MSEPQIIRFSACETQNCANVTIVDDSVDEPEERFFYTLVRSSGLDFRITLGPTTVGEVIIMDNESMCSNRLIPSNTQLYYSVTTGTRVHIFVHYSSIRCSRNVCSRCWGEASGVLLVSSSSVPEKWSHYQLHPLLLPLTLLSPRLSLPGGST